MLNFIKKYELNPTLLKSIIVNFIIYSSFVIALPVIPVYMQHKGIAYSEMGYTFLLFGLVCAIVKIIVGYLSDKFGRKLFMLLGIIGFGISTQCFLLCNDFISFAVVRIAQGVFYGVFLSAMCGYISDFKDKYTSITLYRISNSVGIIIGFALGGYFSSVSVTAPFYAVFALTIIVFIFTMFFIKNVRRAESLPVKDNFTFSEFFTNLLSVFKNKKFAFYLVIFLLMELAFCSLELALPIFGSKINASSSYVSIAFSAYFLVFSLSQIPLNKIIKNKNILNALALFTFFSMSPFLLLINSKTGIMIVIALSILGATMGTVFTQCNVLACVAAPEDQQGIYFAVLEAIMPVSTVIMSLIVGLVSQFTDVLVVFVIDLVLVLITLLMLFACIISKRFKRK